MAHRPQPFGASPSKLSSALSGPASTALAAGPRQAIVAASVLGPEFSVEALRAVTDLGDALEGAALGALFGGLICGTGKWARSVISISPQPDPRGHLQGLAPGRPQAPARPRRLGLGGLLRRAARGVGGVLGHHFALAGEPGRAVHYLDMAGDHAAPAFANDEAVASYRYALDLLSREGLDCSWAWQRRYGQSRDQKSGQVRYRPFADRPLLRSQRDA